MKPRDLALVLTLLLPSWSINAQAWEWVTRYNGPGNNGDIAKCVAVDNAGNAYVTGISYGGIDLGEDIATVKYNAKGDQEWVARHDGTNQDDEARAIGLDQFGNVFVSGFVGVYPSYSHFVTIKYDSLGVEQWVTLYGENGSVSAMVVDSLGDVFVTGPNSVGGVTDISTIKYDPSGIQQWIAHYNGPGNSNSPTSIALDDSGNIYVTGSSSNGTNSDYLTIKYNPAGISQWVATYNGPSNMNDGARSLAVDHSGNIIVTGYSNDDSTAWGADCTTIKYNSSGVRLWVRQYYGPGNSGSLTYSLAIDGTGNICIAGDVLVNQTDIFALMYDASGDLEWVSLYNGPESGYDNAYNVAFDPLGNVYIAGNSYGGCDFTDYDFTVLKYSPSGNQEWVVRYPWSGCQGDRAASIVTDPVGNHVFATGWAYGGSAEFDFFTMKLNSGNTGIEVDDDPALSGYALAQNFPNPFNPTTTFQFSLRSSVFANLTVFDLLGREVATLVNEKLAPGTYTRQWDATGFSSGVYFYRLQAGDFVQTRKLILLR